MHVDVVIPPTPWPATQHRGQHHRVRPGRRRPRPRPRVTQDARWQLLITDPTTGQLIDASTKAYPIPDRIKKPSALATGTAASRLHHPAAHTDTDHLILADRPDPPTNLAPNARGHHLIKPTLAGPAKPTPTDH